MDRTGILPRNQAAGTEPAWYCLRSQPKHEHIAAARLRLLEGVTVFCPRIKFRRETRRGLTWVTEALFPGYLFARFELAEMHCQVRYAHGVSGIVRFAGRYPTIEEETLARLQGHTGAAEVKELIEELSEGDQVRVVKGVFFGLEAVVTKVLPATERVKVLLDFLGKKIEAEFEHSIVLPRVVHLLA